MQETDEDTGTRRSTLVFAINIEHIMSLTNAFRALGIDARPIHVGTTPSLRRSTLAAFRAQEFPVLVNCGILTEGADFPGIDCILLARPTRSKTLYLQMMGRGLRKSEKTGKIDCLVLDLVGNSTKGIVCAPTLFGIDPDTVIEGESQSIALRGVEGLMVDRLSPINRSAQAARHRSSASPASLGCH